jgi:hypothetical protein
VDVGMMTDMGNFWIARGPKFLRAISISAFIASLFLPVFLERSGGRWSAGWAVLLTGFAGIFFGQFSWIGNVILPINLLFPKKWFSAILLFCLISAIMFHNMPDDNGYHRIIGYGSGYYLWLVAIFLGMLNPFFPSLRKSVTKLSLTTGA